MATNPPNGDGQRKGSVKGRSQFQHPNGTFYKRDTSTGRILDGKKSGGKYKGVRKEK